MNCDRCKTPLSGGVDTFGGVNAAPDGSPLFSSLCASCHFKTEFPNDDESTEAAIETADDYDPEDYGKPGHGKERFAVDVRVVVEHDMTVYVWAEDKKAAEKLASREVDGGDLIDDARYNGNTEFTYRAYKEVKA